MRIARWAGPVLALLMPAAAGALGLGDVEVRSALNQRLDARIALVAVGDADPARVEVALADAAAFERAGVARPYFLTRLIFEPVVTAGGGYIRVRSREPVREPAFGLLVDVTWPGGRAQREYSILLGQP